MKLVLHLCRGGLCVALLEFCLGVFCITPAAAQTAGGDTNLAGFQEFLLPAGKLYVPAGYEAFDGTADVLVFFHGPVPVVCSNLTRSGKTAALVVVNGLDQPEAYAKPFQDKLLFGQLLDEVQHTLTVLNEEPVRLGQIAVASFSAGYGAVREILKRPEYAKRISDLVLADSLSASYVTNAGKRQLDPVQMKDFIAFAQLASERKKTLTVTHSQVVTEGRASTAEAADVLLQNLVLLRVPVGGADGTGMERESIADDGEFHLRSYWGDTGEDHVDHLRSVGEALRLTSLPRVRAP